MSNLIQRLEPIMIDMYLPKHIRALMKTLGRTHDETEAKVKEIMGDPEKKAEFMKLIEKITEDEKNERGKSPC